MEVTIGGERMDGTGFTLGSIEKLIYDGRDIVEEFTDDTLDRYLIINGVHGRSLKGVELTTIGAPFFEGDYLESIRTTGRFITVDMRSEEHTSELQSRSQLVCRLLLEK